MFLEKGKLGREEEEEEILLRGEMKSMVLDSRGGRKVSRYSSSFNGAKEDWKIWEDPLNRIDVVLIPLDFIVPISSVLRLCIYTQLLLFLTSSL